MSPAGGYQKPNNPAPVSGPGSLSQRTDGGPTMDTQGAKYISGLPYGTAAETNALQTAAPMAASSPAPSLDLNQLQSLLNQAPVTPLNVATQRPDEPVTQGSPFGDGAGPEILNDIIPVIDNTPTPQSTDEVANTIRKAYAATPSPALFNLVKKLEAEGR